MATVIPVSNTLAFEQSLSLTRRMLACQDDYIVLDCGGLGWVEPLAMLLAVCCADEMRYHGVNVGVINGDRASYAHHMGFFNSLDPHFEAPRTQRRANDRYVAINRLETRWFVQQANAHMTHDVQDYIQRYSGELARVLTQESNPWDDVNFLFEYCLQEILRNIYEHAASEDLLVCAQYWPNLDRVDMAVADRGQGLRSALSGNPHLHIESDKDAIHFALLPGISGRAYKGAPRQFGVAEHWENSGYGLYMTHRLCTENGNFVICSGTSGLRFSASTKRAFETGHQGTIIGLSFRPGQLGRVRRALERFRREGRETARRLPGGIIDPSTASMALRFREEAAF